MTSKVMEKSHMFGKNTIYNNVVRNETSNINLHVYFYLWDLWDKILKFHINRFMNAKSEFIFLINNWIALTEINVYCKEIMWQEYNILPTDERKKSPSLAHYQVSLCCAADGKSRWCSANVLAMSRLISQTRLAVNVPILSNVSGMEWKNVH